jgi:hypothetical protein
MGRKKLWPKAGILAGGFIGAMVGIIAAFILVNRSKHSDHPVRLTAKRSIQIGKNILSLLHSIARTEKGNM